MSNDSLCIVAEGDMQYESICSPVEYPLYKKTVQQEGSLYTIQLNNPLQILLILPFAQKLTCVSFTC